MEVRSGGIDINSTSSVNIQGDIVGRDAIKQFFNIMFLISPPSNLDEDALRGIRIRLNEYIDKYDRSSNADEIIGSLFDLLRKSLGPASSASYIRKLVTIGEVIGPIVSQYERPTGLVLPYASIINDLLTRLVDYFQQHDCFVLYGQNMEYTYDKPTWVFDSAPIATERDSEGGNVLLYSPFAQGRLVPTREERTCRVIPLTYLSTLLQRDSILGKIIGRESTLWIERTEISRSKQVEVSSFWNMVKKIFGEEPETATIKETSYIGTLFFQIPRFFGQISFTENYFVTPEGIDKLRVHPVTFSNILCGISLDLLDYARRLQGEADKGHQGLFAINELIKNQPPFVVIDPTQIHYEDGGEVS
jgi:hypothetical protein